MEEACDEDYFLLPPFTHLGGHGRNLQATQCVLGGKSQVKAVTLFLTPPFRPTPNEAKGVDPIKENLWFLVYKRKD